MMSTRRTLLTFGALFAAVALLVPGAAFANPDTPDNASVAATTKSYSSVEVAWTAAGAVANHTVVSWDITYEQIDGAGISFTTGSTMSVNVTEAASKLATARTGGNTHASVVMGLSPNKRYVFAVRARSATGMSAFTVPQAGSGGADSAQAATTLDAAAPAPPRNVMVKGGDMKLTVTWEEPFAGGSGLAIEKYMVRKRTVDVGTTGKWEPTDKGKEFMKSPAVFEDLTNGVMYEVQVQAVNDAGKMSEWPEKGPIGTVGMMDDDDGDGGMTPTPALPLFGILALFAGLLAAGRARLRR